LTNQRNTIKHLWIAESLGQDVVTHTGVIVQTHLSIFGDDKSSARDVFFISSLNASLDCVQHKFERKTSQNPYTLR